MNFFPNPAEVFQEQEYQDAYEFKCNFIPEDEADYDWVSDYAKQNFEQFQLADQTLDAKAESIMKVLGGGSGLLSIGAIINLPKIDLYVAITIFVSLVFALLAVGFAALVRVPRNTFLPPSVAWALDYVRAYDKDARNRFLAQWHLVCEGSRLSLRAKAKGVRNATWLGIISIGGLALSFLVAVSNNDWSDKSEQKDTKVEQKMTQENPQASSSSAPNPSGVPQTPPQGASDPQANANPVIIQNADPAAKAGPQTIQATGSNKK